MRLSVGIKLGFWLALLGIVSTGLMGYYAYSQSRALLVESSKDKMLTATRVLAQRFTDALAVVANDARFLAALPALNKLGGDHADSRVWAAHRQQVEEVMSSLLAAHPEYFQVRMIGIADYGKELVRIDKDKDGVTAVTGDQLQEKSHFPYFFKTLKLAPGALYISDINLNNEQGTHLGLGQPTLRIATPVQSANGKVFGVIVINVDLNGLFNRIRVDVPENIDVILTNQDGDYLVHPDAARTFGFDKGVRYRIQDEVGALQPLLEQSSVSHLVLDATHPDAPERSSVAAFVKVPLTSPAEHGFVVVGLLTPLQGVLSETRLLGLGIIQITLFFSLLAIAISLVLARILAKPLNTMARAAHRFAVGEPMTGLPVDRNDEIGDLASSFEAMASRLSARVGELQDHQEHLGNLAYHDQLTGLPNRLLFLDRLQQSINKAQRHRTRFAVMFIDLDKFKEINDGFGHAAGDEVLKSAASRMQECIRQADTLARLAGDEFTILLEDLNAPSDAVRIAQNIISYFEQPFIVEQRELYLTCSLGIAIYPQDGTEAETLLDNADAAMYKVKERGRNNYRFYSSQNQPLTEIR